VPGPIAAISAATHGGLPRSWSQSTSCVFLCLKSRYLAFDYNQKSRTSWSAMYSSHPGHKWRHKDRGAALTFSIRILHLPTFQPTTTIPPVQRTGK
jgi:hypothetical protein